MLCRKAVGILCAVVCAVVSTTSEAGRSFNFSSDTDSGPFFSFDWDGGDQGNLQGVMDYAANRNGGFSGVDFRRNQVNMFMVDFAEGHSRYRRAGLTLFVMWGNERETSGPFQASWDISPLITKRDDDGTFTGNAHIYALGAGVTIDDDGPVTVDVDVDHNETPVGFAITNIDRYPSGRINLQMTLAGAIRAARLLGSINGKVWQAVDDDGRDDIFTDGLVLFIPAPGAMVLGLAGLGGLGLISGRRRK